MSIREKKKYKHLLSWSQSKSDRMGAGVGGKRVGTAGSLQRPAPHVVAGSHNRRECVDGANSNWKSATSAAAKLLLRGVKDSAAAFGPLQSVAGGLCFILENCEVRPSSCMRYPMILTGVPANESEQTSDRIVGTPDQGARRISPRTCS